MKKLKVVSVFVVCFFVVSVTAKAGEFMNGFTNYEIVAVDNMDLGKDVEKVWNLTYEGSSNPVFVMKRKTNDGTAYVVQSKYFEVCYMNSSRGFGARAVKKAWSVVPPQLNNAVVNPEGLRMQQIITPSQVDDENALELIAGYLPGLINEQYAHVLN